jgi:Arc/MetJ-type ribon-helix-helix transcriptional regulator
MSSNLNVSLTDKLRRFVDTRASDQDVYSTPSEYVRDLIRLRYGRFGHFNQSAARTRRHKEQPRAGVGIYPLLMFPRYQTS